MRRLGVGLLVSSLTVFVLSAVAEEAARDVLEIQVSSGGESCPLEEFSAVLSDPDTREVRWSGQHDGALVPHDGRVAELRVFAAGHDLGVARVEAGQTTARITLAPTSTRAKLVGPQLLGVEILASLGHRLQGDWPGFGQAHDASAPIVSSSSTRIDGFPVELDAPTGMDTELYLTSSSAIVWPLWRKLSGGEQHAVNVEPLRAIAMNELGRPVSRRIVSAIMLPDLLADPEGDASRTDAIAYYLNSVVWGQLNRGSQGTSIQGVPRVGMHLFGRTHAKTFYRYVEADAEDIEFDFTPQRAWVPKRLGDGVVLGKGALIGPGRLDITAFALLYAKGKGGYRGVLTVLDGEVDGCLRDVSIPYAPIVSIWTDEGVAHVPWDSDTIEAKDWGRGRITVSTPPGVRFTGKVSITAAWESTDRVSTWFEYPLLRRRVAGRRRVDLRGLPTGAYNVTVAGTLRRPDGWRRAATMNARVDITDDDAVHELRFPEHLAAR